MPDPVQPQDLARIPETHRLLIGRWLIERAAQFQPSWLLPENTATAITDVLQGAAVDLAAPLAEDSTVSHATRTLANIRNAPPESASDPAARKALQTMSGVLDGWVEGAMNNHDALGHRGETEPCWKTFHEDDIRQMIKDTARELGLPEGVAADDLRAIGIDVRNVPKNVERPTSDPHRPVPCRKHREDGSGLVDDCSACGIQHAHHLAEATSSPVPSGVQGGEWLNEQTGVPRDVAEPRRSMIPNPHPLANCGPLALKLSDGDQCPTCGTVVHQ